MKKTLTDIAEKMRDIDFTMLLTHTLGGKIAGRPMSNNREVEYQGDSYFFTWSHSRMVDDIDRNANVALAFMGAKHLLGKPGIDIHVEGIAKVVRDRAAFAEHWNKNLDRWFKQGVDTPGVVMIHVHAQRVHYWDGEEEGEITVTAEGVAAAVY